MNKKPKKPDFVVSYEEAIKNGPPRCCHTCADYNEKGECIRFGSFPPEDFAATVGACDDWCYDIPF